MKNAINFEAAYQAASAATSLDDIEFFGPSSALLVSALMNVIQADIDLVDFAVVRYHSTLITALNDLYSACNKVSMKAHALREGKIERRELNKLLSAMFRFVADIHAELNDEPRYEWGSVRDHHQIIAELVA